MPTVLKIGYREFLLRRESDVAAVIRAMIGAIALESKYDKDGKFLYWPDEKHSQEVAAVTVKANQILPCEPGKVVNISPSPIPRKPLRGAKQLQLMEGGR
jgi:hypothetical protein